MKNKVTFSQMVSMIENLEDYGSVSFSFGGSGVFVDSKDERSVGKLNDAIDEEYLKEHRDFDFKGGNHETH